MRSKSGLCAEGWSLQDTCPVFHATDSYLKHGIHKIPNLYKRVWDALRVQPFAATPRGNAAGAGVVTQPEHPVNKLFTATGEPLHDVLMYRRSVSTLANDCADSIEDWSDIQFRLSAKLPGNAADVSQPPPGISDQASSLLEVGVTQSAETFRQKANADKAASNELQSFLQHPRVRDAAFWIARWGARPPRKLLFRLARRLQMKLELIAESNGFFNYRTQEEFRLAVLEHERWYKHGKKTTRPHRGTQRGVQEQLRVKGRRSVVTKKLQKHYRRALLWHRRQGLWRWRSVALGLHAAGIPVLSGTVSVEALWSCVKEFLPVQARRISLPWWDFLADMMFLRYNYRHFNHALLPGWTQGDSQLSQQVDCLLHIARTMGTADEGALLAELGSWYSPPPLLPPSEREEGQFQDCLRMRILVAPWNDAMASGGKFLETQRYYTKWTNATNFAKPGRFFLFGNTTHVAGLAELSSEAVVKKPPSAVDEMLHAVDPIWHPEIKTYLQGCRLFDYVLAERVFDLRGLSLSWSALADQAKLRLPKQRQGFPAVECLIGMGPLLELCSRSAIVRDLGTAD